MTDEANAEAQILRLSAQVAEAERRKDADGIARFIARDYLGVDPSGELIDRAALIERYRRTDFLLDTLQLTDMAVSVAQNAAWEVGLMHLAGTLSAHRFSGRYRYSHFWVRQGSHWLIAGSQLTQMIAQPGAADTFQE